MSSFMRTVDVRQTVAVEREDVDVLKGVDVQGVVDVMWRVWDCRRDLVGLSNGSQKILEKVGEIFQRQSISFGPISFSDSDNRMIVQFARELSRDCPVHLRYSILPHLGLG